jgi:DNA-binding transcriptional ArsR family regulator
VHAFDVLGDPVRRRILELLAERRRLDGSSISAGDIATAIGDEFGISQPAVSQHLKVLRESGFATVTPAGQRRLYAVDDGPLREVDAWLERYREFWAPRLDALDVEIRRGKRMQQPHPQHATEEQP